MKHIAIAAILMFGVIVFEILLARKMLQASEKVKSVTEYFINLIKSEYVLNKSLCFKALPESLKVCLWIRIASALVYFVVCIVGMYNTGYRRDWVDGCLIALNVFKFFEAAVVNLFIKDMTGSSGF